MKIHSEKIYFVIVSVVDCFDSVRFVVHYIIIHLRMVFGFGCCCCFGLNRSFNHRQFLFVYFDIFFFIIIGSTVNERKKSASVPHHHHNQIILFSNHTENNRFSFFFCCGPNLITFWYFDWVCGKCCWPKNIGFIQIPDNDVNDIVVVFIIIMIKQMSFLFIIICCCRGVLHLDI